jgi:hypothetical protein
VNLEFNLLESNLIDNLVTHCYFQFLCRCFSFLIRFFFFFRKRGGGGKKLMMMMYRYLLLNTLWCMRELNNFNGFIYLSNHNLYMYKSLEGDLYSFISLEIHPKILAFTKRKQIIEPLFTLVNRILYV